MNLLWWTAEVFGNETESIVYSLKQLKSKSIAFPAANLEERETLAGYGGSQRTAIIIYTSGSTGTPKGSQIKFHWDLTFLTKLFWRFKDANLKINNNNKSVFFHQCTFFKYYNSSTKDYPPIQTQWFYGCNDQKRIHLSQNHYIFGYKKQVFWKINLIVKRTYAIMCTRNKYFKFILISA